MAGNAEKGGRRRWSRWRMAGWTAGAFMLLLALVAKQFIGEVSWVDNLAQTGGLLIGVGIAAELASRKTGEAAYRAASRGAGLRYWVCRSLAVSSTLRFTQRI